MPKDLISVYVPTRNRVALLERALESVRRQTYAHVEIIVVDDGSNDETPELLAAWASRQALKWIRHETPMGACVARNVAISMATGKFITGLDDDDEMLPDRLSQFIAALRPADSFVCASDWLLSEQGLRRIRLCPRVIDARAILSRNVVGNQIFAERAKLLACGGFDPALPAGQDYDLWIRMVLLHGPARGLRIPLQVVHEHVGLPRITNSPARRRGYWLVYRKHRDAMDSGSRRAHLYNLRRKDSRPTRLPRDFRFWAPLNRLRLMLHATRGIFGWPRQ